MSAGAVAALTAMSPLAATIIRDAIRRNARSAAASSLAAGVFRRIEARVRLC